jgi:hypothetical protein
MRHYIAQDSTPRHPTRGHEPPRLSKSSRDVDMLGNSLRFSQVDLWCICLRPNI